MKWKHSPCYWPFVWGIYRSRANSPHKGQWCGALMVSLICIWTNGWVNNREAGDLWRHRAHYDVTVICVVTCTWYGLTGILVFSPTAAQNPGPRRLVGRNGTTLTIINVYKNGPFGQSDLMVVQCNASNVHGYVFRSGYLNVLGKCSYTYNTTCMTSWNKWRI